MKRKRRNQSRGVQGEGGPGGDAGGSDPGRVGRAVRSPSQPNPGLEEAAAGRCAADFRKRQPEGKDPEAEIKELHAKIGQLTMERDFLSEKLGR